MPDTIIYNVIIKNTNPNNAWTTQCLKEPNRKALIDSIFAMVYDKRVTAYDYDTGKILTPKEIQNREKNEFKRDRYRSDPICRAMVF